MESGNLHPIKDFELIAIDTSDASKLKLYFPNNTNFEGKPVKAIEIYNVSKLAKTPTGRATLNDTMLAKGFLTLADKDGAEHIKQIPLASLVAANNNGLVRSFKDSVLVSQKSYIEFSDNSGISTSESIMIGIYFEK